MPAFPIIDTHLHLWDPGYLRYSWLDGNALLNKPYLLADYRKACALFRSKDGLFAMRGGLCTVSRGGCLGDLFGKARPAHRRHCALGTAGKGDAALLTSKSCWLPIC